MKLRYYLRGLGIGMLVTALVLVLSGNTDSGMSDEAVKRRAAELGMVEKDKTVLGDVGSEKDGSEEEAADGQPQEIEDPVPENGEEPKADGTAPEEGAESAPDEEEEKEDGQEPEKETGEAAAGGEEEVTPPLRDPQTQAEEIEQKAGEVADRAKEVAENSVPVQIITFDVRRGDSSISVARRAEEAGLVKSAADFDVFLCQNGYDKRISIGSYEITVGATEKEIADKITKSN